MAMGLSSLAVGTLAFGLAVGSLAVWHCQIRQGAGRIIQLHLRVDVALLG